MRRAVTRTAAAVGVVALLAAGCSRAAGGGSSSSSSAASSAATGSSSAAAGGVSFGTLSNVCHGGSATGATDQGVTSSTIQIGVLTDEAYNKDPDLPNTAKVFADWCNAAGGIDGRKVVPVLHQTNLMAVTTAMTAACGSDFVLAGGSAALDGLAVDTRLKCLLPDFDAQPVMQQNQGSGLQFAPYTSNPDYSGYAGYYKWLMTKYPDSANHVGVLSGASVITQADSAIVVQTVKADGGTVTYNGTFPISGVSNWTPYAQTLKAKGIKGLTFYDTPQDLLALETALDNIGYKMDWIDANSNAYGTQFIQIAGKNLTEQNNYADLPGIWPVEKASSNPAVAKITQLFQQYAPGQPVTLQVELGFSALLLFAVSAESCGSNLTRSCIYQAGLKQTSWTGGGISAPTNEAAPTSAPTCYNIEQASSSGWAAATGFTPNTGGVYSCGQESSVKLTGLPPAAQLSDVGKSLSDLK